MLASRNIDTRMVFTGPGLENNFFRMWRLNHLGERLHSLDSIKEPVWGNAFFWIGLAHIRWYTYFWCWRFVNFNCLGNTSSTWDWFVHSFEIGIALVPTRRKSTCISAAVFQSCLLILFLRSWSKPTNRVAKSRVRKKLVNQFCG